MTNIFVRIWRWHSWIGKVLTIFGSMLFVSGIIGLIFGISKCVKPDEVYYTNTFLNEDFSFHNKNYYGKVFSAETLNKITIKNKKNEFEEKNGHYISVHLSISQTSESTFKEHKIDNNDFKLKDHTGVYIPFNEIGSMVGWDMIDYHWDRAKNGFVISSADFKTQNTISDYSYIGSKIAPGKTIDVTLYFWMDEQYNVENQVMVLEIDFRTSLNSNVNNLGEDIILLPRPLNLQK